jgi:gamma-glutamyltranspeptidase / glutathione hydrolase
VSDQFPERQAASKWQLRFFLNRAVFGLPLQAAIEAPKFSSERFPNSFGGPERSPMRVRIETTLGRTVVQALAAKGHDVQLAPDWSEGFLLAGRAPRT